MNHFGRMTLKLFIWCFKLCWKMLGGLQNTGNSSSGATQQRLVGRAVRSREILRYLRFGQLQIQTFQCRTIREEVLGHFLLIALEQCRLSSSRSLACLGDQILILQVENFYAIDVVLLECYDAPQCVPGLSTTLHFGWRGCLHATGLVRVNLCFRHFKVILHVG